MVLLLLLLVYYFLHFYVMMFVNIVSTYPILICTRIVLIYQEYVYNHIIIYILIILSPSSRQVPFDAGNYNGKLTFFSAILNICSAL